MPLDGISYLSDAEHLSASVLSEVLTVPPPMDMRAWAIQNVELEKGQTQFPGPYDPDRFPFFNRLFEVGAPDHPATDIVLKKSAQLGGTLIAQILCGAYLDWGRENVLYLHPTEGNAKRWARQKWRPFIKSTTALTAILPTIVKREAGAANLYQETKDGRAWLQISGASSEASLSMLSVRIQIQDDLSKWSTNDGGDPEIQADSRSSAFADRKVFKIGTPLIKDNCRISKRYDQSTQESYHVPCPHCGHMQPLEWENMAATLDEAHPEDAHFTCTAPDCGKRIDEHHRYAMNKAGRWVAKNVLATVVGLYLWTAYSPLKTWADIARKWFQVKGDPAAEQGFFNDWIGQPYDVQGEAPPAETLRDRARLSKRRRGIIPFGHPLLVLAADCQGDRVEWQTVAYGRFKRRAVVDHGVIEGFIGEDDTRKALDSLVKRQWRLPNGRKRGLDLAGIDGNYHTEDVYDWVRKHPGRVIMLRGDKGDAAPPLALIRKDRGRDGKIKRYAKNFYNVGVSQIKASLYKYLSKDDPLSIGYVDFCTDLPDGYFDQLTAERRVPETKRDGYTVYVWKNPGKKPNEALDTMVYSEALAHRLGWRQFEETDWDRLEAERDAPPDAGTMDLLDLMETVTIAAGAVLAATGDRDAAIQAGADIAAQAANNVRPAPDPEKAKQERLAKIAARFA